MVLQMVSNPLDGVPKLPVVSLLQMDLSSVSDRLELVNFSTD